MKNKILSMQEEPDTGFHQNFPYVTLYYPLYGTA